MLKKVRQVKLYEDVAEHIEEAIIAGDYKPGDKLPPERELEEILGASRGTIRQSLRMLAQKGVLEIKTGARGGAFVRQVTPDLISKSISLLIRFNYVSPDHIANFREHIEGEVIAKLAVENADEEDLAELITMFDRLVELTNQKAPDWEAFDAQEHKMHVVLGKMTKNPLYEALSNMIMQSLKDFPQHMGRKKNVMNQVISEWTAIIDRLQAKDARAATSLISKHISKWNEAYKAGIKK